MIVQVSVMSFHVLRCVVESLLLMLAFWHAPHADIRSAGTRRSSIKGTCFLNVCEDRSGFVLPGEDCRSAP